MTRDPHPIPPAAELLSLDGHTATVRCPFCGGVHQHPRVERGARERRAPLCGWHLTPEQRGAGYTFDIPLSGRATRPGQNTEEELRGI